MLKDFADQLVEVLPDVFNTSVTKAVAVIPVTENAALGQDRKKNMTWKDKINI